MEKQSFTISFENIHTLHLIKNMHSIKNYSSKILKLGDKMKYFIILYRSVFFYSLIAVVYRIMGKREIGELSIMDFIVSIFIAEMVAISIENYDSSIMISLIPIIVLVLLQILLSFISLKSTKARNLLDGTPSIMIAQGKINFHEMKKQRYNIDDLLTQLRGQSIKSIAEVDYAVLETSGKLSVFKKADDQTSTYPLPIIIDSKIQKDTLVAIQKTEDWLEKELKRENIQLENIFYGFYKEKKLYIIEKDKIK